MNLVAENSFGCIRQEPLGESFAQLVIEHQTGNARVSLYGGQVLAWQPTGEQEVFWLSETATYQQDKAIRGGIPLCWPWFGAHPKVPNAGNHGFARNVLWQLASAKITAQCIELELIWQGENHHPQWPHKAKIRQKLVFSTEFKQQLIIENLSSDTIHCSGALHSYFAVSQPSQVVVPKLNGVPFDCKLTGEEKQQDILDSVIGPIDRVYFSEVSDSEETHSKLTMDIIDTGFKRVILLTPDNVHNWVLWNPGRQLASEMADIHSGGEQEYFCLEAANTQPVSIAAGKSISFGQAISIKKL